MNKYINFIHENQTTASVVGNSSFPCAYRKTKANKGSEHRSAALSKHICTFTVISISFLSKGEI